MAGASGRLLVTPRDEQIIRWLVRMRLATAAHIGRAFHTTPAAAARRARALCRASLLRRERVLWGLPSLYVVLPAGARLTASPLAASPAIDLAGLRHDLALVSLSLDLLEAVPGSHWISERELRRERAGEDGLGLRTHFPDGVHVLPDGRRVAVELDLTPKTGRRLGGILRYYARSRAYDAVRYFLPTPGAAGRISALARDLPHVRAEVWIVPAEAGGGDGGGLAGHGVDAR